MILPRDKRLRSYSTKLRNEATPQEKRLWYEFLRTYPVQINRQRIIGNYIVDFYCAKARLAIELDGSQHYEESAIEYDATRTEYLSAIDIQVLRFTNAEISNNFQGVCATIDLVLKERTTGFSK